VPWAPTKKFCWAIDKQLPTLILLRLKDQLNFVDFVEGISGLQNTAQIALYCAKCAVQGRKNMC